MWNLKKKESSLKFRKSRKEPIEIIHIKKEQEISEFSETIKDAFEKIH